MGQQFATFTTDGSVDATEVDLLTLKAGDTESLSVVVDGFEDSDTIEIHLYAKQDPSQDDDDADTVHLEADLSTPDRFTGARQADFSFTTTATARLLIGRRYVVRVLANRSGTDYTQTVMLGAIAATYPGSTVTAPSDEAYLRALGDADTYTAAKAYADGLAGLGTITFSQISDRTTASTGITKVGTIATGVWNGTAITDTYLATIATAGKVSNSATTAVSTNTPSAIVARDGSGNFAAGTITATFAGNVTGSVTGNLTGNVTGNGAGTWTGSLVGNASTATLAATATTATSATTATLAATATALATARAINGVNFDGTAAITITAAASTLSGTTINATVVTSSLTAVGTLVTGTWNATAITDTFLATIATAGKVSNSATTATANNTASAIVARDSSGNFTAGTITATSFVGTLTGNVAGNVTGGLTGNATTATALQTARAINGVSFDGSAAITVTAAAGTLTGATLAANVLASSLTSVGSLTALTVAGTATVTDLSVGSSVGAHAVILNGQSGSAAYFDMRSTNTTKWFVGRGPADNTDNYQIYDFAGSLTALSIASNSGAATFGSTVITPASTTARSGLRIAHGAAPTSPVDGDAWTTTAGAFVRINGVTKTFTLT
jgi:hypothetical protein